MTKRELRFRAWTGKEMLYGVIPMNDTFVVTKMQGFPPEATCLYTQVEDTMQWTGLTDVTGKEIYENDIIEYTQHYFNTSHTQKNTKVVSWLGDRWNVYETAAGESDIIIIGNIHQTKEK